MSETHSSLKEFVYIDTILSRWAWRTSPTLVIGSPSRKSSQIASSHFMDITSTTQYYSPKICNISSSPKKLFPILMSYKSWKVGRLHHFSSAFLTYSAYIECSALENRGLRHIVEEAVWILNSAVIASSEANAILANNEPSSSLNNGSRKWSLSSSYPSSKSANFITKSRLGNNWKHF